MKKYFLKENLPRLALCDDLEREEGVGKERRNILYNYDWFMLLYSRNQHEIVKQFSTNLKIDLKIF